MLYSEPFPEAFRIISILPSSMLWSIIILLPSFMIIFKVSQVLFPGRVGVLMMSEVIVAIVSASILVPTEKMIFLQWVGATAIILAGLIEVLYGSTQKTRVVNKI